MLNGPHRIRFCAALLLAAFAGSLLLAAGDQYGQVLFNGLPVPGATIVATQNDKTIATTSDLDGRYRLTGLADGAYTLRIEMRGFAPLTRELIADPQGAVPPLELALLPFEEIKKIATISKPIVALASASAADAATADKPNAPPIEVDPELERQAAEGLLVNGSVNNAAASPFAQARAFGNARPGQRSLYNGNFGFTLGTAALDARPYSFSAERAPRPDYTDMQFMGSVGGPFKIPGIRNRPVFFAGYQHSSDHSATAQSAIVPTLKERAGDFSDAREIRDPETGRPFAGNTIPASRISPQAAALLAHYPQPNVDANGYNYETTTVSLTSQDSFQSRISHGINARDSLLATANYQRTSTEAANLFGFVDSSRTSTLDASTTWSHRFSQFVLMRTRYQFLKQSTDSTPHFSNRINVSGAAGIAGNDQDPIN
ncbi:MAG TPA: carboxypeptidase-like regulatory domain-containing protein, partial [Vicinamibacterales bacterium]|nr:carboxypeptidase-like regulatory domain-containing protein [Vicinamibacterales bacterium]